MSIKAKNSIYDISPYVAGESKSSAARIIKLSSNEGAFGPSPAAIKAVQAMTPEMHRYPDGGCVDLRKALADKYKLNADHIVCGAGSDELISLLCKAYAAQGDEILYSAYGFLMYGISAKVAGATPVLAPEKDLTVDPDALLSLVSDKTKILFLANPNNPTGTHIKHTQVKKLHAQLPKNVLLVLDAAYVEYIQDPDYDVGHDLVREHDNVVVLRTFSKAYGLAGLRLGWAHCPAAVADVLNRVRGPFNVSNVAQIAAMAALKDNEFLQKAVAHNNKCRDWTKAQLEDLGLKVCPSAGNFLLVDFGSTEKSQAICGYLKERGILVRPVGAYGLPEYLRISIGTEEEMEILISEIKSF